ncbi:MAG: polyhydroxyalkanoic acid system family protein [Betaproteobacteria bacterium]|nr:polyhydroxyalkanoic acid system family protein [Betaproteobacteria bacterium]
MADIDLKRVHGLGLPAARKAAEKMAEDLGRKFSLVGSWTGDTLHFDRPGVAGTLAITDKDLHLSVKLGFLLKAMRGPIERAVHEELDSLFAKQSAPAKKPAAPKPVPSPKKATGARKKGG